MDPLFVALFLVALAGPVEGWLLVDWLLAGGAVLVCACAGCEDEPGCWVDCACAGCCACDDWAGGLAVLPLVLACVGAAG